jgi:hypothetical protein
LRAWLKRLGHGDCVEAAEGTRALDLLHGKQTGVAGSCALYLHIRQFQAYGASKSVVLCRRVLPGLCQPIVNGQIGGQPSRGAVVEGFAV